MNAPMQGYARQSSASALTIGIVLQHFCSYSGRAVPVLRPNYTMLQYFCSYLGRAVRVPRPNYTVLQYFL